MKLKEKFYRGYIAKKEIKYFGFILTVPSDAKFVAVDFDERIYSYDGLPHINDNEGIWERPGQIYIGEVDLQGEKWFNTLKEVD
jgi:hypothetical protein